MFDVAFGDDVDNAIREAEVAERKSYIAASLLDALARSIGILNTPETVGSLAEGLTFSDELYQGDASKIAAIGACVQFLGGASPLVQKQLERSAKDRTMAALDGLQISQIDTLIKVLFIVWIVEFALPFQFNTIYGFEYSSRNCIWKRSLS